MVAEAVVPGQVFQRGRRIGVDPVGLDLLVLRVDEAAPVEVVARVDDELRTRRGRDLLQSGGHGVRCLRVLVDRRPAPIADAQEGVRGRVVDGRCRSSDDEAADGGAEDHTDWIAIARSQRFER